ncbi:MAG: anti-sigma factor [Candidatus Eremiobacteraeota bacterium]|nr:anti-sigma factor [Candidatus Eremiobacteraeota bacterium]
MNGHDDELLGDVALLALGVLPEAEARKIAAHVATCERCRREYDELRSVASLVGYGAEVRANDLDEFTSARLKAAVMRGVRSEPARSKRVASWTAYAGYAAAAAAIVVAVLSSTNNATLRSERAHDLDRIAALQARSNAQSSAAAGQDAQLAALVAPDSRHYAVPGGNVVTSGGRVYLALRRLAQPPPGKVYQAWTLASGAKTVAPSVTFVPSPGNVTIVELPERATGLAAVAVTLEPSGGSKTPTSKPAFTRPLS